MILGTAGHIDHGKTTLVRALTGVDTDRLPEEKRRGITIDLGFAPLVLEGVGTLGVVDVPGHEGFVRTMVCGASGVDLALLVVAADEGVMPQTREHLSILALLGVTRGVVALTKADLVDADWLALVQDDVRDAIADSALEGAAIVPVSATRGTGLDELRAALATAALGVPPRAHGEAARLPIDRAFTVKGTGTVVTGTLWSGSLHRDGVLRVMPAGIPVRVRGLHAHSHPVHQASSGTRVAVALAGAELAQVARGATLVEGAEWRATKVLRADVQLLRNAQRPLGPRTRVRLHLGTADVGARVVVAGGALVPGEHRPARLVLDEPIVARAGDRFVIRAESPVVTIGGGIVRDPYAPARGKPWPAVGCQGRDALALMLDEAGTAGVERLTLPVRLALPAAELARALDDVHAWTVQGLVLSAPARDELAGRALARLAAHHVSSPLDAGLSAQSLRASLHAPDAVAEGILTELIASGRVVAEQGLARLASFAPTLSDGQRALRDALLARLDAAGSEPPALSELVHELDAPLERLKPLVHHLVREGVLVAVESDRFYAAAAVQRLVSALASGMAPGQRYGPSELRELLGVSRKFMIPLLVFCDRAGHTIRDAEGRRSFGKSIS